MPIVGRKPKPEAERRNRSRPAHDWIEVLDVPYEGEVPSPGRLPAKTKRWWETISRMPHVVLWDESDWQYAIDSAQVHALWIKTGRSGYLADLARREKRLGTTWDARRDLRIRYVPGVEEEETERPVSIEERRRELEG